MSLVHLDGDGYAGRSPAPPPPDAAERTRLSEAVLSRTVPSGLARSAAPQEHEERVAEA